MSRKLGTFWMYPAFPQSLPEIYQKWFTMGGISRRFWMCHSGTFRGHCSGSFWVLLTGNTVITLLGTLQGKFWMSHSGRFWVLSLGKLWIFPQCSWWEHPGHMTWNTANVLTISWPRDWEYSEWTAQENSGYFLWEKFECSHGVPDGDTLVTWYGTLWMYQPFSDPGTLQGNLLGKFWMDLWCTSSGHHPLPPLDAVHDWQGPKPHPVGSPFQYVCGVRLFIVNHKCKWPQLIGRPLSLPSSHWYWWFITVGGWQRDVGVLAVGLGWKVQRTWGWRGRMNMFAWRTVFWLRWSGPWDLWLGWHLRFWWCLELVWHLRLIYMGGRTLIPSSCVHRVRIEKDRDWHVWSTYLGQSPTLINFKLHFLPSKPSSETLYLNCMTKIDWKEYRLWKSHDKEKLRSVGTTNGEKGRSGATVLSGRLMGDLNDMSWLGRGR